MQDAFVDGKPWLLRFFDQTNVELTSLYDQEARQRSAGQPVQVDPARQGHLWMLRQDLAAYVLLGDPAVRLPHGALAGAPRQPQPPVVSSATVLGAAPALPVATPNPAQGIPGSTQTTSIPQSTQFTSIPGLAQTASIPGPAQTASIPGPTQTASIPGPTQSTANADAFGLPAPVFGPAPAGRSADDATLRALEEAVAQAILADLTVATAAARVGLSRDALAQLVAHYREIGRRALAGEK